MSELSPGWVETTLGDLIASDGVFTDGDWVETKDQDPGGSVRLTQLADVGDGVFRDRSTRFLRTDQAARLNCTFLESGDVLIARMPDPLGRACVFPGLRQPAVTAVDVCVVRPGTGSVEPRWLMWTINAPRFRARVLEFQTGTTRRRISRKNLARIELRVPPLNEQRRIVAAIEEHLSRLDAADASLAAAQKRLAGLRRAALVEGFNGSWPSVELVRATDLARPICYGILKPKTTGDLRVPYVEVRSIKDGRIDVASLHRTTRALHDEFKRSELRAGDVVLAIRGSFDRAAVVPAELAGANISRDVARIAPLADLDADYLAHYLGGPAAFGYFAGAARGVGVRGVNIGDLRTMPIPLPPLEEQRRIVQEVEERLSRIDAMRASIERAQRRSRTLRAAILERAFSGELVPQDPADEPAEALLARIRAERDMSEPATGRRRKTVRP